MTEIVSVIIPSFERANLLPRALDSVLAQNLPDGFKLEVIVVDDGSTDDTRALVNQKYPQINYIYQANQGVSCARNTGLEVANGSWIALLDSDDEWLPHKLDMQFSLLSANNMKVCHTHEIWVRDGVRVNQMNKHQKRGGDIFVGCLPLCAMSPSSIVIHRDIFDQVGVFDEQLPACEDYDLWLRISAHHQVAYVQEASIVKYGGHQDQLSRAHWGMDRFRVYALCKLLDQERKDLQLKPEQRGQVLEMLKKKNRILLNGAIKRENQALYVECNQRIADYNL